MKLNELKQENDSYSLNTIQSININKYSFNSFFRHCDLVKINNNRFLFTSSTNDNLKLILLIFDIFNNNKNTFIRYYQIFLELYNFKYYNSLRGVCFNNFIGLAFSAFNNSISSDYSLTYSILLGYINSTDPITITQLFEDKEDEYIFEINKYTNINFFENNIFGYELLGIKIVNISGIINNGMKLIDSSNNIINENDVISYENNITIKKTNTSVLFGNYTLIVEPDIMIN